MARTKRSAKLDTWNARKKLKTGQMNQERIGPGQYIAYRKPTTGGAGTWIARWNSNGKTIQARLGTADDLQDSNGNTILTYPEALSSAMEWFRLQEYREILDRDGEVTNIGSFTVADAMKEYVKDAERRGKKTWQRIWTDIRLWILPTLGSIQASKLTRSKIELWQAEIANSPRRVRSKTGLLSKSAPPPQTDDEKRARKVSANYCLAYLKAGLTYCANRRLFSSLERPWVYVKRFSGVNKPRIRFLSVEEQARLIEACPDLFKPMLRAALLTGCRYGELTRLTKKDYDPKNGTIFIEVSKTEKSRHVYLSDEGREFFDEQTAKLKNSDDPILSYPYLEKTNSSRTEKGQFTVPSGKAKLQPFRADTQNKFMHIASEKAGMPYVRFHELRHTYASTLVNAGCLLTVIAKQLGHTTTQMVEAHYGHLAKNTVRDEVIRTMPRIQINKPAKNTQQSVK